jgi:hypothetical protein
MSEQKWTKLAIILDRKLLCKENITEHDVAKVQNNTATTDTMPTWL